MICLMNFHILFSIYVFEIKEFIADIPTELSCSGDPGDLENPGQLLVQEVLRGTDDFVLWNFIISQRLMLQRTKNSLLTFLLSYPLGVTLKTSSTGS